MNKPNLLFPTPVWTSQIDDYKKLNETMYTYIKEAQTKDQKGINKSNIKGWHSKDFDLKDKEPKNFINCISPSIKKVMIDMNWENERQTIKISNMWAIINIGGSTNTRHQHGNSTISGAYYVKAPKNCGKFIVENPNIAKRHSFPPIAKRNELNLVLNGLEINEGDLLLFPGYLPHKVAKNEADEDRIVISFNVDLKN